MVWLVWPVSPTQVGLFPVRVRASNASGADDQAYALKVVSVPVVTSPPALVADVFAPYRYDADGLPTAVGTPPTMPTSYVASWRGSRDQFVTRLC